MNWREKIADWISGGALTRATEDAGAFRFFADLARNDANIFEDALREIAASPGERSTNGTLRRVIRIAREALE